MGAQEHPCGRRRGLDPPWRGRHPLRPRLSRCRAMSELTRVHRRDEYLCGGGERGRGLGNVPRGSSSSSARAGGRGRPARRAARARGHASAPCAPACSTCRATRPRVACPHGHEEKSEGGGGQAGASERMVLDRFATSRDRRVTACWRSWNALGIAGSIVVARFTIWFTNTHSVCRRPLSRGSACSSVRSLISCLPLRSGSRAGSPSKGAPPSQ